MSAASLRGRWAVLCDGGVVASFATDRDALSIAVHHSLGEEFSAVALMRLGPTASRTLRRFAAGQEITR